MLTTKCALPQVGSGASIVLAVGFGQVESSDKIYLKDISSLPLALRTATWDKVGVLDASLPLSIGSDVASSDFQAVLSKFGDLKLIVRVFSDELLGFDSPPRVTANVDLR